MLSVHMRFILPGLQVYGGVKRGGIGGNPERFLWSCEVIRMGQGQEISFSHTGKEIKDTVLNTVTRELNPTGYSGNFF